MVLTELFCEYIEFEKAIEYCEKRFMLLSLEPVSLEFPLVAFHAVFFV